MKKEITLSETERGHLIVHLATMISNIVGFWKYLIAWTLNQEI